MVKVYARSCESDGKNFYTVPKSLQAKVKAQIEADGYVILEDGTVVKDIPSEEEWYESNKRMRHIQWRFGWSYWSRRKAERRITVKLSK